MRVNKTCPNCLRRELNEKDELLICGVCELEMTESGEKKESKLEFKDMKGESHEVKDE